MREMSSPTASPRVETTPNPAGDATEAVISGKRDVNEVAASAARTQRQVGHKAVCSSATLFAERGLTSRLQAGVCL